MLVLWMLAEPHILRALTIGALPPELANLPDNQLGLVLNDIQNIAEGNAARADADPIKLAAADHLLSWEQLSRIALAVAVAAAAIAGVLWGRHRIFPALRARNSVERTAVIVLIACSTISVVTTVGIVLSLLFESLRFFAQVPVHEFLFGLQWSPQTAMRADQVGSSGAFGAVPLFAGTLLITLIAMLVAVPIGLMAAIYMADYATKTVRAFVKPALEVLGGHSDRGLRLLRRPDGGAVHPRRRPVAGARCGLGKRAGRRRGHGHHDHTVRLLAVG